MITIGLSLSAQNSDVEPMPLNPSKGAPYERIEKTFPASAVSYYRIDPRLVKNTGILSKQKSGEETFFSGQPSSYSCSTAQEQAKS
jgi:hypothetical protein